MLSVMALLKLLEMVVRCYNSNLLQLIFISKSLGDNTPVYSATFPLEERKLTIITGGLHLHIPFK